jgi:hypothetical protein
LSLSLRLSFPGLLLVPDGREVVVLVQTLEEHVEHGNVPDSPVTLGEVGMVRVQAGRQLVPRMGRQTDVSGESGAVAAISVRALAAGHGCRPGQEMTVSILVRRRRRGMAEGLWRRRRRRKGLTGLGCLNL